MTSEDFFEDLVGKMITKVEVRTDGGRVGCPTSVLLYFDRGPALELYGYDTDYLRLAPIEQGEQ